MFSFVSLLNDITHGIIIYVSWTLFANNLFSHVHTLNKYIFVNAACSLFFLSSLFILDMYNGLAKFASFHH